MLSGGRTVTRKWPNEPDTIAALDQPRDDLVLEHRVGDRFVQLDGPFITYERRVDVVEAELVETTNYRLSIPWFNWLFALPIGMLVGRRWHRPDADGIRSMPWWTPPDRLNERQVLVLGLLAAASMASAFINTIFTQTAEFAADEFGVGDGGIGDAGSVVRAGIVIAVPAAFIADRLGRRRVIVAAAWLAPTLVLLGAVAPTWWSLVGSQALGRPTGLALAFLVGVIAAEEMPKNSRAYAVSILAMAGGLGAGIAVMALPLADLGERSWRLVYLVTTIWFFVALDLTRRLPETLRFEARHPVSPPLDRSRFLILAVVAVGTNLFVAPASFFQNSYLQDVRGFSATQIAILTLCTATPAGIGLIIGGRSADMRGRRRLIAVALPIGTGLIVVSYSTGGIVLPITAFLGGFIGSIAVPALAVYRSELFPTGNRSKVAGMLTATALLGGIFGLQATGALLDDGWSYSKVMGMLALGQIVVVVVVLTYFPETAHRELEELNPEDEIPATISSWGAP